MYQQQYVRTVSYTHLKGLDLVNDVIPSIMDEHTQVVVLGTGDAMYEDAFRYYENKYKGNFCAYIAYNENVAHNIYAGCDALLVPSRFEPCGLTQLISMRYGSCLLYTSYVYYYKDNHNLKERYKHCLDL